MQRLAGEGIAVPTYCWSFPSIVKEFLQKTGIRKAATVIFIDNVAQNASKGQFPAKDAELQFFADCPTVNFVLTSRMAAPIRANSVRDFPVPALDTNECIDLFYYYWKPKTRSAEDIKYIEMLIERAHHHPLGVEKMARSARCQEITEYLDEIKSVDFNFYFFDGEDDVSVVTELVKLFDLKTRTDIAYLQQFIAQSRTERPRERTFEIAGSKL